MSDPVEDDSIVVQPKPRMYELLMTAFSQIRDAGNNSQKIMKARRTTIEVMSPYIGDFSPEDVREDIASFLDAFSPKEGISFNDQSHKSLNIPYLNNLMRPIVTLLERKYGRATMPQIFEVDTKGTTLMDRLANCILLSSIEELIRFGIHFGPRTTPLTVLKRVEEFELFQRSFLPGRWSGDNMCSQHWLDKGTIRLSSKTYTVLRVRFRPSESCLWVSSDSTSDFHDIMKWCKESKLLTEGLTWFHLSSTDGLMLESIMDTISVHFSYMLKRHFRAGSIVPGDPLLNYREVSYWAETGRRAKSAIVFPTLALTTIQRHAAARKDYEDYRATLTTAISEACSSECTVHLERTLDEAYFPGLDEPSLGARNAQQVVSREFEKGLSIHKPLVVVPQLWLWRFDNVIVSAHSITRTDPSQFKNFHSGILPLREGSASTEYATRSAEARIGLIIGEFIRAFGEKVVLEDGTEVPPTLDLFERQVVSILSAVQKYTKETKRDEIIFETEESFHEHLSDFRSELAMIQHILRQQEEIFDKLIDDGHRNYTDRKTADTQAPKGASQPSADDAEIEWPPPEWISVLQTRDMLTGYQARAEKIDGDAQRIEKNVQDLLNLKRTYVSIENSHASVRDSHASVLLSVAAVGFAIITIIFAPLAFLTALFALRIQGFESLYVKDRGDREAGEDPVYHGGKLAGVFIGTEVLTIIGTAILVWITFRLVGIDLDHFSTMRAESDQRREDKKKLKLAEAVAAAEAKVQKEEQKLGAKQEKLEGELAELKRQETDKSEGIKTRQSLEERQASETSGGEKDKGREPMDLEAQLPEPRAPGLRMSEHREM